MAILQNIRTKFGLGISIIIALALLYFIIDPSTLESSLSSMSSKYDVGQINGKSVSYTDFQEEVENFSNISEMLTNSTVKNEQQQAQVRNTAWQSLIDKYMFLKNAKAAGINVGETEMVDLTSGDMVSPIIAQIFADENGNFSQDALLQFLQSVEADETGRSKQLWNYLQNTAYTQQFYAKYGSLFTASDYQAPLMLQKTIAENNNTTNVEFVMVPFSFEEDSTIVVPSSEIKKYYTDHKDFFKQGNSKDMEYVVFEVIPSENDVTAESEKVSDLVEAFAESDNLKSFLVKNNSDRAYSEYWYKEGELSTVNKEVSDFVDANGVGAVSPVIKSGNTFYIVKVVAEASRPEGFSARIIQAGDATEISDSLLTQLRVAEPMKMTQSYIIPGVEELFTADLNKPQLIKTSQYGQLLAEVVEKDAPVKMKQVAIYEKTVLASKETFNDYYSKANKFATIAVGGYDNYKAAVDSLGVYSHPMNRLTEDVATYGSIENAKEVTRWVFENKPGKVSNIITVDNKYFFIATVKAAHKEGYAPVEEVANSIRTRLYADKVAEKKTAEVAAKINGLTDLQAIADALKTTVSTQDGLAFSSLNSQGADPAFIGAASVSPEGKVCGPIAGNVGVYVYKVTGRDTGSFYTEDDAKNFAAQKGQYNSQMILPVMMQAADVKDNRARFY